MLGMGVRVWINTDILARRTLSHRDDHRDTLEDALGGGRCSHGESRVSFNRLKVVPSHYITSRRKEGYEYQEKQVRMPAAGSSSNSLQNCIPFLEEPGPSLTGADVSFHHQPHLELA